MMYEETLEQSAERAKMLAVIEVDRINNTKTLRDEFAMAALTGMLSHPEFSDRLLIEEVADKAYYYADAMMNRRNVK